jgi:hypothetical protein
MHLKVRDQQRKLSEWLRGFYGYYVRNQTVSSSWGSGEAVEKCPDGAANGTKRTRHICKRNHGFSYPLLTQSTAMCNVAWRPRHPKSHFRKPAWRGLRGRWDCEVASTRQGLSALAARVFTSQWSSPKANENHLSLHNIHQILSGNVV